MTLLVRNFTENIGNQTESQMGDQGSTTEMGADYVTSSMNVTAECLPDGHFFVTRFLPLSYSFLFIASFILNCMAGWVFFHLTSKKPMVVFLKNIIVADLVMTMTFPFTILSHTQVKQNIHAVVCQFSAVIFYVTMYINIILLGLISLNRYVKIVRDHKHSLLNNAKFAKIASVLVWIIMFLTALPNMFLNETDLPRISRCIESKSVIGVEWHMFSVYFSILIFFATCLVMSFSYVYILRTIYYSRANTGRKLSLGKQKSRRKVFYILGVFFVCFVPYNIYRVLYPGRKTETASCTTQNTLFFIKEGLVLLSAVNTCLDPILYFLLCKSFTRSIQKTYNRFWGENKQKNAQSMNDSKIKTDTEIQTTESRQ
ncbi:P2Y purinoceptor 14-like [Protopterus annectens]|uniref:P2Y purinoceptor 14-like n=1 Tax=Protopterus annectens TaxID=7888 RepID=UPI001CF931BC|nr:P2Y purinoceptor 14-like [Protopterus annectens]